MKRKRKISRLGTVVVKAAKELRKKKLTFEREASTLLSEALGFEVTVKIKRSRSPTDRDTTTMKRFARKPRATIAQQIQDNIEFNEPF